MKNRGICIFFMTLFSAVCFASEPKWLLDAERTFPSEKYIHAISEGQSNESAKNNALSELGAYFSQTVFSNMTSSQTLVHTDYFLQTETLTRTVSASSVAKLFAVHYTKAYYDKFQKTYAVCAYILREEAWSILEPKLEAHYSAISKNLEQVKKQKGLAEAILVSKALESASDFEELHRMALVVFPNRCEKYAGLMEELLILKQKVQILKREIKFKINIKGDADGRIYSKISSLLSKANFTVCKSGENHIMNVNVDVAEQITGNVHSVYPQIFVEISDRKEIISSFSKSLEKVSAYNSTTVQRMALSKIEEVLETEFLEACLE